MKFCHTSDTVLLAIVCVHLTTVLVSVYEKCMQVFACVFIHFNSTASSKNVKKTPFFLNMVVKLTKRN